MEGAYCKTLLKCFHLPLSFLWCSFLFLSMVCYTSSYWPHPFCSDLDPGLQHELRQYLATRGIEEDFTNNLLLYLHKKEQGQYTGWLQKLKEMMDGTWVVSVIAATSFKSYFLIVFSQSINVASEYTCHAPTLAVLLISRDTINLWLREESVEDIS